MIFHIFYLGCLLFSFLVALANFQILKSRQLALFVPFLAFVFIQEFSVFVFGLSHPKDSTAIVYNIYSVINASFFVYFYFRIIPSALFRKLMILMLAFFTITAFITFFWLQPITIYNSYLSLASGLVITCCGVFFLFNYFNLDNIGEEKKWSPVLWITIGIVSFYPVVNISFAFYKHLLAYDATLFGYRLYRIIPQLMSIFMYGCFAYAFYLCRKKK